MVSSLNEPEDGAVGWAAQVNQNFSAIESAINENTPTGVIQMFGGASAPTGWLLCDGTAVSRTTYADLFNVLGTTFGPRNGSTTFNLPDLRGRSPLGAGQGTGLTNRTRGQTLGEEAHSLTVAELAQHNHTALGSSTARGISGSSTSCGTTWLSTASTGTICIAGSPVTGNNGSGNSHNTMHPCVVVSFIVKT